MPYAQTLISPPSEDYQALDTEMSSTSMNFGLDAQGSWETHPEGETGPEPKTTGQIWPRAKQ